MNGKSKKQKRSMAAWGVLAVMLIAVGAFGYTYFNALNVTPSEQQISQVLENPDEFYGQEVAVTGKVEEIMGANTFTLDAPEIMSEKLLVISSQSLVPIGGGGDEYLYDPEDRVNINGTVYKFNLREMEQRLGRDLVDSQFIGWEGKPVIIANTVEEDM